jgi:hypothetical protein
MMREGRKDGVPSNDWLVKNNANTSSLQSFGVDDNSGHAVGGGNDHDGHAGGEAAIVFRRTDQSAKA